MKTLVRLFFTLALVVFINSGIAQNFLATELKSDKNYILLAHPTVHNLETIHFLLSSKILQLSNVDFVGVYSSAESYDYNQSVALTKKPEMSNFHLQKIDGTVNADKIYQKNEWSGIFKSLFDCSAGIFFFGGPDIQPEIYGQKNLYSQVTDPNRHLFELSFLFHLLGGRQNEQFVPFMKANPGYFVTGFCLGLQTINVATGGTLTQDIPAQTYKKKSVEETLKMRKDQLHRNYWQETNADTLLMSVNFHPIEFTAHPFFLQEVKAKKDVKPLVLSSHHQSIYELGKDIIVTAISLDGQVIEGIHHRLYPNVFAVQFHPEVPDLYKEGKKLRFAPNDEPQSYYATLSPDDREFHLKYWKTISGAIKSSISLLKEK